MLLIRLRVLDHEQVTVLQGFVDHFFAFAFSDTRIAYFENDHQVARTIRVEIARDVIIVHNALDVITTFLNYNFSTLIRCKKPMLRSIRIFYFKILFRTLPLFKICEFDIIGA